MRQQYIIVRNGILTMVDYVLNFYFPEHNFNVKIGISSSNSKSGDTWKRAVTAFITLQINFLSINHNFSIIVCPAVWKMYVCFNRQALTLWSTPSRTSRSRPCRFSWSCPVSFWPTSSWWPSGVCVVAGSHGKHSEVDHQSPPTVNIYHVQLRSHL